MPAPLPTGGGRLWGPGDCQRWDQQPAGGTLLRYRVDAVFHGHGHRGTLEGRTIEGVPVYNVARPLLSRSRPDQPPFRLFELPRDAG